MSKELKQVFGAFVASTALVAILGGVAQFVGFVHANLGAFAALVFLYMSVYVAKCRGGELADYGFTTEPRWPSVGLAASYIAIVFPIFAVGFVLFYELACSGVSVLSPLAPPGMCVRFDGWTAGHWPMPSWALLEFAFIQVIVVALPEELFFRGLLHDLCERALPAKRKFLGGQLGWALVLSSFLFALGHLAVTFDARRLAVFFPGLVFGWMRSKTGSILAGTIAHTASNLFIHILQEIYFP